MLEVVFLDALFPLLSFQQSVNTFGEHIGGFGDFLLWSFNFESFLENIRTLPFENILNMSLDIQ